MIPAPEMIAATPSSKTAELYARLRPLALTDDEAAWRVVHQLSTPQQTEPSHEPATG